MNSQILMVVDPDDMSNILGYYYQGQIYADLYDIKAKRKEVSADVVHIKGKGIVNLAQLRAENYDKIKMQAMVEARLTLDPMTRSLRGL